MTSGSIRSYAAHRGVTPAAVRRAIADERLVASVTREGRRVVVDFERADLEWAATTMADRAPVPLAAKVRGSE